MLFRLLVASLILTLLSFAHAHAPTPTVKETNASRFARGLPPLRPRSLMRRSLGRKRYHPSPSPSPLPLAASLKSNFRVAAQPISSWRTGRIQVRNSDGLVMGYVKNTPGVAPVNGINFGASSADVRVEFALKAPTGLVDLAVTNPSFNGPTYLGARSSSRQKPRLSVASADSVDFLNVGQTPPSSGPLAIPGTSDKGESAIWTFYKESNQLIPHFINADGTQAPTKIVYSSRDNKLFFTGDVDAWNAASGSNLASPVTFHLRED